MESQWDEFPNSLSEPVPRRGFQRRLHAVFAMFLLGVARIVHADPTGISVHDCNGERIEQGRQGEFAQREQILGSPRLASVLFMCNAFSTDLPLAESKQPIHRVWLNCQLTDGGTGVFTLDPNIAKFDEFGDPAAAKPLPLVKLACTLKLIKQDDMRALYEVRGPKIVSRLSLVAYRDIMPWGDGRLLVHTKDGSVRYVIDLYIRRPEPAPKSAPGNGDALR